MTEPEESDRDRQVNQIIASYLEAERAGQVPDRDKLLLEHPDLAAELRSFFEDRDRFAQVARPIAAHDSIPTQPPEPSPTGLGTIRYLGDYELLEEIARGGMGIVFKARQATLNRLVAVKTILAGELASPVQVQRFRKEAEAAAQLDHPNIVPIYEVGEHNGQPYFSMKLIEGVNLAGTLPNLQHKYGAIAQLVVTIARALHYAHQRGIIHRDLKPGNVLIDGHGQPHITDFGLAKTLNGVEAPTRSGTVLGTPGYMAPEQAAGQVRQIGVGADVYSLGAILYELLTGLPPFRGKTPMEVLLRVVNDEPVAPRVLEPKIPRDLETICLKCLEKSPRRRYATAQALAEDLERWRAGEPIVARRTGALERLAKWARRRPAVAGLTLAVFLSLLGLLVLGVWSHINIRRGLDEVERQRIVAVDAREREAEQRAAAESARDAALAETYRALLSETKALRLAHPPGWRAEALRNLRRLQQLDTPADRAELRSEAIACISEFDLFESTRLYGGNVWSVDFSPDGTRLASASYDGKVHLWDMTTGRELRVLDDPGVDPTQRHLPKAPLPAVRFQPGGDWFGYSTWTGGIAFGPWRGNEPALPTVNHKAPARYLAFDAAGRRMAVAWGDGRVGIHDASSGETIKEIDTKARYFHFPVALSPDGKQVALMAPDHTVQLHPVADDKAAAVTLGKHRDGVRALCFSPSGDRLASASADHMVKLWNLNQPGSEPITLVGHSARVNCAAFHPDGSLVVSGGDDRTLRLWDTKTGELLRTIAGSSNDQGNTLSVAFSPDGTKLAASDTLTVYQLTSREGRKQFLGHSYGVAGMAFHPEKPLLASGAWDRQLIVWDLQTGRMFKKGRSERNNPIHSIAAAPDGSVLATGLATYTNGSGTDFAIDLWDWQSGQVRRQLKGPQAIVTSLAFSSTSKLLAAGTGDGTWFVWDLLTDAVKHQRKSMTGAVRDVAFLNNGRQLLIAGATGLELFDVVEGKTIRAVAISGGLSRLACTRDEHHVAIGGEDGTLRILSLPSLEEKAKWSAGDRVIDSLAYSPNGRILAASGNRMVSIWASSDQQCLFRLPQSSPVHHLAFDLAGVRLAICGASEIVTVWDLALIRPELRSIGLDWESILP
jgi:WD40 repeat protein/tRNA A-37 threonylcarbamoyl transferase component Bud32